MSNIEIISKMEILPIAAPTVVIVASPPGNRQDGFYPKPSLHISELDKQALDTVLMRFIKDMYEQTNHKCDWVSPSMTDAERRGAW